MIEQLATEITKQALGEQAFNIIVLSAQLRDAQNKIAELEKKLECLQAGAT